MQNPETWAEERRQKDNQRYQRKFLLGTIVSFLALLLFVLLLTGSLNPVLPNRTLVP